MINTIGVFFGSRSPEHDISIITAQLIISGLKDLGYAVVPVYINKKGEWLLGQELGELKIFTDPDIRIDPKKFGKYYLDLEAGGGKLVFKKKGLGGRAVVVELAFPAIHGSFGEDGTIQGLFEMFNVPYVGCDVTSSAIAMDKVLTKQLYEANRIATTRFVYFFDRAWQENKGEILNKIKKQLRWPVFVKPARLGSSIGIAKVQDKSSRDLEYRIEVSLHYDQKVLVEEAVENVSDLTCCVIGNEEPQASLIQESVFDSDFFGFEEKYLKAGGAQLGKAKSKIVIPAKLSENLTREIQVLAVRIFRLVGCSGIARIDFLLDKKTGKYFAIEINPLPGTLYHHLWEKSGVSLNQLLKKLINFATSRHQKKNSIATTFESDILKLANSQKLQLRKNLS